MPSEEVPKKKKWCIRCILWKALVRTCTVIGAMMLISAVIGGFFSAREVAPSLPQEMVLYLPLEDGLAEHPNDALSALSFGERSLTLREAVTALEQAAQDKRVKGIVAEFKGGHYGLSQIQELRAALDKFNASGDKFSYIYGESFTGVGGGLGSYYLASAFDEIWMQPMGTLSIAGIGMEMPFARELMDKLGVTPEFFARKEYKNLFESFTSSEMSDATREAMEALIDDLGGQLGQGIAQSRGMTEEALRAQIDRGLLTDEEALAAGLVDRLDYTDVLTREIRQAVSGDPEDESVPFVGLISYAHARSHERYSDRLAGTAAKKTRETIALVYVVGAIMSTADGAPYGETVAAADELSDLISSAAEDKDIHTIVVRIDSPGGSPAASETIRRALTQAQGKGKKIIVSMGATAASGGYWIASPADYIFAAPATLTGSIGVAGGKFALTGLWEKVGVNWEGVQWGDNAGLWSPNKTLSASERERFDAMMDRTYEGFIARVAEGRHMSVEEADKVARGRVWTGAQARDNGLVDQLGGLSAALDYVAVEAGLPDRTHLDIVVLPRTLSPVEQIVELLEGQVMMGDALQSFMPALSQINLFWAKMNAAPQGVFMTGLSPQ